MIRTFGILTVLAAGAMSGIACAHTPQFSDCPAIVKAKHATPPLLFSDARARQYRSAIREASMQPVDFAGHYVLAQWGCGSGCVMAAAIDKSTGRVTSLPFSVSDWPLDVTEPLKYQADSCLLVIRGSRNESAEHGTYYYAFDGKRFTLRASKDVSTNP
ncbi:hypothetical protein [Burkholderia sp. Ax-1719]|uniref:hypothetical protein n=1 Tax=Burkholderia sp. Ax-1719 TaxID=2608334 RepID=UPI0014242AAC|nr:hypothetical protein [Burkholderia sp. Ax-1719]NIE63964.1 hypothetical protein [Burkholderia sp. Ax-1719]